MSDRDSLSRVSVIIPTYNRSKLLRLTVESVLAQTYPNIEIIVVDDGSTDDTAEVMAQYAGRVTYIREAINQGGRTVFSTGLRVASGEYINFLDHDDLFMPTKIERQVQVLDSRPEIGLVHCRYYHIDADGNLLDKVGFLPEGDVLKELVYTCITWSGAPLIRRQCLDQVRLFDEPIWYTDWGRLLRIALAGYQFACVQEPLGAYRIRPDSAMANVTKTEQLDITILDRVFADPQLPADVAAVKDQAYGAWRFWLSCRYYATGHWDDAQRNLAEALALRPELLEHPKDLLRLLSNQALRLRVGSPVKFVADVLGHLPSCANGLRPYRSQLLSHVYAGLALRNYGVGHIAEAKRQFAEAIALHHAVFKQPEDFANSLYGYAMSLPVGDPAVYVDTVLQNLPAGAERLKRIRSRVLSEVSIGCAFEDYAAGRRRQVARWVFTALRYRPSWLWNKGVVSIFLRSLPALLTREYSPA